MIKYVTVRANYISIARTKLGDFHTYHTLTGSSWKRINKILKQNSKEKMIVKDSDGNKLYSIYSIGDSHE